MARPVGNWNVKNPNIIGSIHNMIWLVDCCFGSVGRLMVVFCVSHMVPPTRTGSKMLIGGVCVETRPTRSMPRKSELRGTDEAAGFQE